MIWLETRFPPPLVALVAGVLMWSVNRWVPFSAWLHSPWTRLGVLPVSNIEELCHVG